MYVPPHFAEDRPEALHDLIRAHPLGVLVTHGRAGLDANHIPFELAVDGEGLGTLHSHVARANPVWQELADGDEVLVIFRASDAYVSPNWYPSKHELHRQVPTWNYLVVHAHGRATIHDDERYVRGMVARLTRTHEAGQPKPWRMSDSSKDYIAEMVKAIVGLEIEITRLTGKFKLSQNKEPRDIDSAGRELGKRGATLMSEAMARVLAEKG